MMKTNISIGIAAICKFLIAPFVAQIRIIKLAIMVFGFVALYPALYPKLALSHDSTATYIANEAVLVEHGDKKILFDPFFHHNFGIYQLVPEATKAKIFAGQAPFNNIDAIVISHAHGDHFAADEVLKFLSRYPSTQLIAPQQAIEQLLALPQSSSITSQLTSVKLNFNDAPLHVQVKGLNIDAVRIPHAGWPGRADVENIVFRVTLPKTKSEDSSDLTVMHMGDADPDDDHYLPYKGHWQAQKTHVAFPPYWFYSSLEGNYILEELIHAERSIGIHVPMEVPALLKKSKKDYFSQPGETRVLNVNKPASN